MGVVLGVSGRQVEMDRCKGYGEQTTRAMPGYRLVLHSSVGDSICEVDFRFQGAIGDKPEEVNGTQFMSYTLLFSRGVDDKLLEGYEEAEVEAFY